MGAITMFKVLKRIFGRRTSKPRPAKVSVDVPPVVSGRPRYGRTHDDQGRVIYIWSDTGPVYSSETWITYFPWGSMIEYSYYGYRAIELRDTNNKKFYTINCWTDCEVQTMYDQDERETYQRRFEYKSAKLTQKWHEYNAAGKETMSWHDEHDMIKSYYDEQGRCICTDGGPKNNYCTHVFTDTTVTDTVRFANGETHSSTYDHKRKLLSSVDSSGVITTYEYDTTDPMYYRGYHTDTGEWEKRTRHGIFIFVCRSSGYEFWYNTKTGKYLTGRPTDEQLQEGRKLVASCVPESVEIAQQFD